MQRRSTLLATVPFIASLALVACATSTPGTAATAKTQCGFVTDSQGVLPEAEGIFGVDITRIDGKSTTQANRHKLDAGTHTLTVAEYIPGRYLSATQIVDINRMKKREDAKAYKTFEVTVVPGTTLRIGARVLRDKLDNASIDANAYWEPVVWETVPSGCP